ncbi:hypothetical protein HO173_013106 [Letharia columbiana]|uniref:Ubiquitin-like domain-containing protein n=1 Tax=Letharia columbiana TaxID=112416 RepID=A0A8H6CIN1_9LECA|nr:uncharacterized protein HO173_013106 [Letharia columbiana]KAF6223861.1 hypothetical protein HO173_013106 [Letharia columbiana]
MDGLSAVAGVATAGAQLSKSLYDLYTTVRVSRQEIQDVANNVSLLAMVLEELDGVLRDDGLNFKPRLREAAQSIVLRCAGIFKDIQKHTGADLGLKGRKFREKLAWYFKRERVKPLRSSLESLKSTLNILLHVVQLAKSTKGIEEYPGVKHIGHWYVRKERRGLVCLVIDNRHAVERLKHFEDQTSQTDLESIENEPPLAFADIFPLSESIHKRGQSPERKFVVAFWNPTPGSNEDPRRSQDPDINNTRTSPSTPNGDRSMFPSSPRENRSDLDMSIDSDAESIGRSTSSQTTRRSRSRSRPMKEQATSRLILNVIPHETADENFKSAQRMSRSTLLEAKAEETIDTLMRHWTYVDPRYFSEDDGSSLSPETSLPLRRGKAPQHIHEASTPGPYERPPSLHNNSRRPISDLLENSGSANELDDSQNISLEGRSRTSSTLPAGRRRNGKELPSSLPLASQNTEGGRGAKAEGALRSPSDQGLQSPKEPSTPAPPYLSSHSGRCLSCSAVSPSGSPSGANKYAGQPADAKSQETVAGNEASVSMDSAFRLFENKMLEMMKRPPLQHGTLDAQSCQESEQQAQYQQSITTGQEAEPVILKDCLGRKFVFPIDTCRSWQDPTGDYDILSPTGEIILPEIWGAVIKPGWVVELRFGDFAKAAEISQKDLNVGVIEMTPDVKSSPTTPGSQLARAKRRASLRTWLGNRKSTPSVALE